MKTKLITINFCLTIAILAAILLWENSDIAWGRPHRLSPQPDPTPTLLFDSEKKQATVEQNGCTDSIVQLQDLRYPIRVLIYQGGGPIRLRSAVEPSPALYPASCRIDSSNLVIDGRLSEASEHEVKLNGEEEIFSCASGYVLQVENTLYRGCIKIVRDGKCLRLINYVSLEDYLRGVVPKELLCNSPEAVKAQAVVARTYALARLYANKIYDIDCGIGSQVYGGASAEATVSDQAVAETAGLILTYQGKLAGQTLYHSACGGRTESPLYVYGSVSEPYLVSVKCVNAQGEADCAASPHSSWRASWSKDELGKELSQYFGKKFGAVAGLEIVEQGPSGRVSKLKVHFENGSAVLLEYGAVRSALQFKDEIGHRRSLPSAKFTITEGRFEDPKLNLTHSESSEPVLGQVLNLLRAEEASEEETAENCRVEKESESVVLSGQGWGHGVGMCQWGAMGMAKRGEGYVQILARYFVNTQIDSLENLYFGHIKTAKVDAKNRSFCNL